MYIKRKKDKINKKVKQKEVIQIKKVNLKSECLTISLFT